MIIKPRVRGFICVSTHPTGCEANVKEQIDYVKARGPIANGPKKVLVIGASTGYGLAARISAAFGCGAATLGVFFERGGSETKAGTAGWYNSAAFEKFAGAEGLYASSINGDAFSDEVKARTIEIIKRDLGQVDLVVYSLAAPKRTHPKTGEVFTSTLKPVGKAVTLRGIDTDKEVIKETVLEPATQTEIDHTVPAMGGEDWQRCGSTRCSKPAYWRTARRPPRSPTSARRSRTTSTGTARLARPRRISTRKCSASAKSLRLRAATRACRC